MINRRCASHVVLHEVLSGDQFLHFALRFLNLVLHHVVARLPVRGCPFSLDLQVLVVGHVRFAPLALLEGGVGTTSSCFAHAHS